MAENEKKPNEQENFFDTSYMEEEQNSEEKSKNIKHHILVVEDNEEIRRYISLELSSKYHVRECCNGKESC